MKKVYVNEKWCLGCHLCEYHCAFAGTNGKDMAGECVGINTTGGNKSFDKAIPMNAIGFCPCM